MDERQKLRDDLERYRTLRDLITDEPAIEVIEIMIKERKTAWPTLRGGGAIRMARIAPESFSTVRRGSMISRPDPDSGRVFIEHRANLPSGGHVAEIEIGAFLRQGKGPEYQELLRLIGTLLDETANTHADRSRSAAMRHTGDGLPGEVRNPAPIRLGNAAAAGAD
jgi:hypothetical protein